MTTIARASVVHGITLAIDVATRCVLGLHLTLEAPGGASVAACIAHACLPKDDWLRSLDINAQWPLWGLPQRIQADNAREFRADAITRGCDEWGIQMSWRPLGKPHYGGHIERLIGTLMGRIHLLPGTTQSNPQARGAYKAEKAAQMTLSKLGVLRWLQTVALPDIDLEAVTHQQLLRSMDALVDHHEAVDAVVAGLLRPMIDQDLSVVFYDLTTILAEGLTDRRAMFASLAWPKTA